MFIKYRYYTIDEVLKKDDFKLIYINSLNFLQLVMKSDLDDILLETINFN